MRKALHPEDWAREGTLPGTGAGDRDARYLLLKARSLVREQSLGTASGKKGRGALKSFNSDAGESVSKLADRK